MKPENHKSIALVASEAAIDFIRRDVSDHGEAGSERRALVDAWRESAERDFLGQIHFRVSQGDLIAVSGLNGELFNPRMGGPLPTDAMWLLSPEQESKALELLGQSKPDTRPVFTTPPNPREIPVLLRKLPPDTNILFRSNFGIRRGGTATVAEYVEILEEIIRRQSEGIYVVDEAAQILADFRPGKSGSNWAKELRAAHRSGALKIRSSSIKITFHPKFPADNAVIPNNWTALQDAERDYLDIVKRADIDRWLRETAGYGFPMPERTLIASTAWPANRTVGDVNPPAGALFNRGASRDAMGPGKFTGWICLPMSVRFVPVAKLESLLWKACACNMDSLAHGEWGYSKDSEYFVKLLRRWQNRGALTVFAAGGFGPILDDNISSGVLRREDFIKIADEDFHIEVVDCSDEVPHAGTYSTPLVEFKNITNPPERIATENAATTDVDPEMPHFTTAARSPITSLHRTLAIDALNFQDQLKGIGRHVAVNFAAMQPPKELPEMAGIEQQNSVRESEARISSPVSMSASATAPAPTKHTLKSRANVLTAVLSLARRNALDTADWRSVWATLVELAQSPNRPAPLLGYTEGEGVKYQQDDAVDPVGWLTREAYRKRFSRER